MTRDSFLWRERLNNKNVLYYHGEQCERVLNAKNAEAGMEACYVGIHVIFCEALLDEIYEQLPVGADVYIVRIGNRINFQKEGLMLIKHGFEQVVQMKHREYKRSYVIHCRKGKKEKPLLSVIVPLYNEESTAGELLEKLINRKWVMDCEFIIVESNSKDRTREIAQSFEQHPNVKLILEDKPSGKGNGVLRGIREATGQFIAIQDGDLEYDVEDYDKLLPPIRDYQTLFMLGSRYKKDDWRMRKFSGGGKWIADYLNLGQKLLTWLLNTACGCKLTDPFTMYKIFHKDCMYGIDFVGGNFGLDWELVIRFIRKGYMPMEIPIYYKARSYAEGKHIDLFKTPLEGLKALWHCKFAVGRYDYGDE